MLYLNQLDYPDMKYMHDMDNGGALREYCNVAHAGCGPCCMCMTVDMLTTDSISLEDCISLSEKIGANRKMGTSLRILGKEIADRYNLEYEETSDSKKLIEHLQSGGIAVANSGGDREGYTGVFTHGGHYVCVISCNGNEMCILDPSWKEGKYEEEGRQGKVRFSYPFAYCDISVLSKDCENRDPSYYLFKRK